MTCAKMDRHYIMYSYRPIRLQSSSREAEVVRDATTEKATSDIECLNGSSISLVAV